jgi:transposase
MKKVENQSKEWKFFIGVDVSKLTWDLTVLSKSDRNFQYHVETANSHEGWDSVLAWLESKGVEVSESLFCMESTGVYCHTLLSCLSAYGYDTWVENALRIKNSSGIVRGKNDKQDSLMIASFAKKNYEEVRLYAPTRVKLERMKNLMRLRESLMKHRNAILLPLKEQEDMGVPLAGEYKSYMKQTLAGFEKDITRIESELSKIISTDEHFKELHDLITSVVGVGTRTAVALIVYTNEFANFSDARELACYCGVVPFEKESGSSVRGRTKVSKMCNHTLKSLLHLSALSAVRHDVELKAYYEKKKAEGKKPMSVLNAVRNKLVHRIFAVVKRKTPFEKYEYFKAA